MLNRILLPLYLRHGFRSESEDVEVNRVKSICVIKGKKDKNFDESN